jgi:ATP-dependent Lhr-like helicase
VRATPIAILTRKNWPLWQTLSSASTGDELTLSHTAQAMLEYLRVHGASFFDDIASSAGPLRSQAEDALGELVSAGLVNADSFSGLRALLIPAERKRRLAARRRRIALFGLEDAGRWSLMRKTAAAADKTHIEQVAMLLLKRYGVMFRRLITREAQWLPPWYDLLRVYRRLEAQGHIRGGRFVAGVTGEQYALPDAVGAMRAARKQPRDGKLISLSAVDPLNLTGILSVGARVPALSGNRVLLRDGVVVATHIGGETQFLAELEPAAEWEARNALLHKRVMNMSARAS